MNKKQLPGSAGVVALVFALTSLPGLAAAQERKVPETYTAVTTHMTPADVEIKADILDWSTDEQRAAVVAALSEAEDPAAALRDLPTLGVVWRSGSAIGSSIKYAVRESAADGSETITLVTDKRVGATSFSPWTADDPAIESPPAYSVIELNTGNAATGSMSLAAAVVIDAAGNTVALDPAGSTPVLTAVAKAPKPYWAANH
jgi:hypothetical protein